jgi:hypothetical protein
MDGKEHGTNLSGLWNLLWKNERRNAKWQNHREKTAKQTCWIQRVWNNSHRIRFPRWHTRSFLFHVPCDDVAFVYVRAGEQHPHPGHHYPAAKKTGLLPDNAEGDALLKLVQTAWERKILFRLGNEHKGGGYGEDGSVHDVVCDNGIVFKTAPGQFPDPTYLDVLREALERKGVVNV